MAKTIEANGILYRGGYKYQLDTPFSVRTPITGYRVKSGYVTLEADGWLHVRKGYAWDGPSGPTVDTTSFIRGSLAHDALYQLMRDDLLPLDYRAHADALLRALCRYDGMGALRAWYVWLAVRVFGGSSASAHPVKRFAAP